MAAKGGVVGWLREVCGDFRRDLLSAETATVDEIAAIWPGGKDNPDKKLKGWIRCYGQLHALNGIGVTKRIEGRQTSAAERQEATLAALADTPESVQLQPQDGEEPQSLTVYPKSWVALEEISKRNLALAWLIDQSALIEQHGTPDDLELLLRARDEQSYLQRVLAWIATTPGVGLPFAETDRAPEPPSAFSDLHPADFYAIAQAFQRVNVKRLLVLESTRKNETRPDWSVFLTAFADGKNRDTPHVMRDMSLASVIAQSAERARGHEQAMVAAERERKQRDLHPRQRQVA